MKFIFQKMKYLFLPSIILLSIGLVFSYDNITTHPVLTDAAIEVYEKQTNNILATEQAGWIVDGSINEDADPRYLNHYYDPTTSKGLNDFDERFQQNFTGISAKEWARDQNGIISYTGDYSIGAILKNYKEGNSKRAYQGIGHILHLIQDMSVPAHTRNDSHAEGDPYENWAKQNGKIDLEKTSFIAVNSVDQAFDELALFSHGNFFSKSSVRIKNLANYKIIEEANDNLKNKYLSKQFNGQDYKLCLISNSGIDFVCEIKNDLKFFPIHSDYWNILHPKAVGYSAGVIDYFIKQFAEIDKENRAAPQPTLAANIWNGVQTTVGNLDNNAKYIWGDIFMASRDGVASIGTSAEETYNYLKNLLLTDGQPSTIVTANLASPIGLEMLGGESVSVTNADVVETPANPIGVTYGEQLSAPTAPVIAAATLPTTPTYIGPPYVAATEAIPDWFPRQHGSLSRDSGGGGGGSAPQLTTNTTNNQPPTTPEGETSGEATTTTATTTPAIPTDTTPPDIVMSVTECATSISTAGCLLLSGNINISWNSAAEDLAEYELTINNIVIPLATATTTAATTTLADNSTHTISLRAKDTAGNRSEAASQNIEVSSAPVVINEVAWAGTENGSSNDEWLELYNRTNQDIDLTNLPTGQTGWTLFSALQKPYINLVGVIPAKSYFLLERKDDTTISDITADQIYGAHGHTGDWALNNSGEVLTLTRFNGTATTTIDQTILCGNRWCGGSNNNYYTSMERVSPDTLGTDPTNWSGNLYSGVIRNGKSANGVALFGTPKQRNSVSYLIANGAPTISQNLTLKKANSPYLVNNQIQTVAASVMLTIEPGVVIKFHNSAGLAIYGTLSAQGIATEPIVFTSLADDTYGGDTNGDATSTSPLPGDWYGLSFKAGSDASALLHILLRHAGKYYISTPTYQRASVVIENSSPSITDSTIEYSNYFGLSLAMASSTISGNIVRNNANAAGINISGGAPNVENNTLSNNSEGIVASSAGGRIINNILTNNAGKALSISGGLPLISGNSGNGNTINGIILSGETSPNSVATLAANSLPYIPQNFTVAASSTLNISAGTVFKPQGNFYVYGTVNLNGATPSDILFTSPADDAASGDTTNDGAQTPMPGSWIGLTVFPGGALAGGGATFRYGGYAGAGGQESASIMLKGGNANLRDTIFENNYPHGLTAETGASLTLTDSVFRNHNFVGVWGVKAALAVWGASVNISGVTFTNNTLGILSDSSSFWSAAATVFQNNLATTTPANLF